MQPDQQGFVERAGVSVYYETFGADKPAVLLPTWSIMRLERLQDRRLDHQHPARGAPRGIDLSAIRNEMVRR